MDEGLVRQKCSVGLRIWSCCFFIWIFISSPATLQASFAVVDAESGRILAEQEAAVKMPPASITKITTVYVALQESTPDEQVRISRNASNQEGSSVYLKKGDVWRLESLLYATMLQSGNDAAVAVAEHVAGSEEAFVELSKFEDSRV
ncbi:D-alanyl-D-alanine carboxypeptidase family protein [Chryseomicrobium aureum]|uniref:D-alanyl-D-alanine carboxypeptidase family protein n=1 Tax=Chryseomicrobium aureum TaxID=1441723 RepID=UPI00370D3915